MDARSNRAEQYARLFRKAGVFAGKGDLPAAIKTLEEGAAVAGANGDAEMEQVFRDQIATHRHQLQ